MAADFAGVDASLWQVRIAISHTYQPLTVVMQLPCIEAGEVHTKKIRRIALVSSLGAAKAIDVRAVAEQAVAAGGNLQQLAHGAMIGHRDWCVQRDGLADIRMPIARDEH